MNLREHISVRRTIACGALAALSLTACGSDEEAASSPSTEALPSLSIADPWSRQPADGQTSTAMYGTVSNPGSEDVTIVSASSPVTEQVELHETIVGDDGAMQMVQREEGFVVPAGGEFIFEPGGPHVMLIGIDPATYPDTVEVTLNFDDAEPLTVTAEVRSIDGEMDHEDHDHGEHEGMDDHGDDEEMDASEMDHEDHNMTDTTAVADMDAHDHGDEGEEDAHDTHTEGSAELDVTALHEIDEQLAAGNLNVEAQREVVAGYIEMIEASHPEAGSSEEQLLAILHDLDAALAAEDRENAAVLATEAHDLAHDLGHGHG